MASAQPLKQEDLEELAALAHAARGEVKKHGAQMRKTAKALAQLDDALNRHGIGLQVQIDITTALGGTEDD